MSHLEFSWQSKDGLQFFAQEWRPDGNIRAGVALVHGIGEHSGRYRHVADYFNKQGIGVVSMDHRGHGRTGGLRGHGSYDQILEDIDRLLEETRQRYPGLPIFLYGHSLGGSLVLYYVLKRRPQLNGVICTSPGLIPAPQPQSKIILAHVMAVIAPSFRVNTDLDQSGLSRDPSVAQIYAADPLVHGMISARLGLDLLQDGEWIIQHASEFSLPLLLMHGSADRLADPNGSKRFASQAKGDITFKMLDGWYHELHNEPDQKIILDEMVTWIDRHLT
ncbi:lysophospholipase [Longilinea arvoryzae]|uniref:Monoacylglycerol lipase n=1 Tax=Longilinea arvoryzae TaxID=360412 RepID=A0A0S7BJA6_9CHLR|nr:alpha/beta hydrolase [Longilinea arvoryzae]GAP14440.1 lysophospholipase [Longilinea arvoryzae]